MQRLITFALVCFGWIFFRANNVSDALSIVSKIFSGLNFSAISKETIVAMGITWHQLAVIFISVIILGFVSSCHYRGISIQSAIAKKNIVIRWTFVFVLIFVLFVF